MDNRLARDPNWSYRNVNFGNSKAADRSGWQNQADTDRTMLPYGYEDVKISDDD